MRCSNCLSHVDVKSGRGICSSCGLVIDLQFEDGTSAIRQKGDGFRRARLLSISGVVLVLLALSAASYYFLSDNGTGNGDVPASLAEIEPSLQNLTSTRFDRLEAGELVAALTVPETQQVTFASPQSGRTFPVLITSMDIEALPTELYLLQDDTAFEAQELPQDVNPEAVIGLAEGGFILAHTVGDDLIVIKVGEDGESVWRRPIFLDGQEMKSVRISTVANTILVDVAMQGIDKTVHYLLSAEGRLSSLRSYEGNALPAAALLSDDSIINASLLPLSEPGTTVWSVARKSLDGRVVWKAELPDIGSQAYETVLVTNAGDTYALSTGAQTLVKLDSDGAMAWQQDFVLPVAPDVHELVELADNSVALVSISTLDREDSVLRSIAFSASGAKTSPESVFLDFAVTEPGFVKSESGDVYLTGRGLLQRATRQTSVFVLALDTSAIVSDRFEAPAQRAASVRSEPVRSDPPVSRPADPEPVETLSARTVVAVQDEEPEPEPETLAEEEEDAAIEDGFDWVSNPSAECRFVCLDDNESPLVMGRNVSISGEETRPNMDSIHKQICSLVSAVADLEQAPDCSPTS